ncbi:MULTISPECIES: ABC transporter substrate-binding protein [Kitasatospora]|uniref:Putative amino acid ABC transporter substrate-binding protein n=1 Tax=Kitasatospora setae (strain ATCC 33774 / DSM 43861 / JCM 3304 / KCC A-0304 / NBRC 14216 / KM-6054) TaxID=452652 RepID=E4NGV3_KITSK|nr:MULTISPECIES: ABC transporter substrate-binding protein [Kitasatospora]BAJ30733.1 putative amino acid ABC transporter substrate-binding protein [Kitasatospora setae KM-6054]
MPAPRTPRTPRASRPLAAAVALAAGSLLLTACGSSVGSTTTTSGAAPIPTQAIAPVPADPALAGLVPADLKSAGKLVIGSDTSYAPNEFKDEKGKIVGMDVDLGAAIAQKLGLTAEFQSAGFTDIIPGIQSNKYQLGMSSFTVTKARQEQVDMVSYFSAGTSAAVKKGNPDKIALDDLCGKKVAVQDGTTQADEVKDTRNPACAKAGKPAIPNDGDRFALQTDVAQALVSGRDQVMLADSPVVDYALKQTGGQLEKIGETYDSAPYGVILAKGSPLSPAVQGAIKSLMADGTYKTILDKWGVAAGAVTTSEINAAQS